MPEMPETPPASSEETAAAVDLPASNASQTQPSTQAQQDSQQKTPEPEMEGGDIPPRRPRIETFETTRTAVRGVNGRFEPLSSLKEEAGNRKLSYSSPEVAIPQAIPQERGIKGLAKIPKGWGELPANASLAAEIAWVQSNRLLVVEEKASGGIVVNLDKARTKAPSWAALGWLETSIRSYAKFVEVAAKQASSGSDEAEFQREERMAISEMRALLEEMLPGQAKPKRGRKG